MVLVTDAHTAAAVATVRSLGRRGVACTAGWQRGAFPLAATSRWCRRILRLPDPLSEPDAYADLLLAAVRRDGVDAVMPISDATRTSIAAIRPELERHAVVCAAPERALAAAEDKWGILERAASKGLAAPPALLVADHASWRDARERLQAPVVLRSRWSLMRSGGRLVKPAGAVVFAREAALREIAARMARGESTIVTPYRPGTGRGIYLFMHDTGASAWFGHVRVRETDPRGSAACAAAPSMPSPEELAGSVALASALGLTGAVMLEFRRSKRSEPDWLVEINPRLWGSVPLAVHAGFDFPWWQLRYFALGERPEMPRPRGDVVGCRWLTAEIGHLVHALRGAPPDWLGPYPTKREAWRGFRSAFADGWRYYHQDAADPLPGIAEPLTFLASRLPGRAR